MNLERFDCIPCVTEDDIMLVLSRKPGEKVHIGADILVTVLEVKGNRVRLGIEAPRSVTVTREELLSRPEPQKVPVPDLTGESVN